MAWVRKDENAALHPKFFRAGIAAYGWHDAALGYCNRYLTDGFIPLKDRLLIFPGISPDEVTAITGALVREGLLETREDGWMMHDYLDYQPSRRQALKLRRERHGAARKGGVNSGRTRQALASTKREAVASTKHEATCGTPGPARPVPARTDPTRTDPSESSNGHGDALTPDIEFKIPKPVIEALDRCPRLGAVPRLRLAPWWRAELRANPGVALEREVFKAEAYLVAHPERHYKKLDAFLHGWLGRAEREGG